MNFSRSHAVPLSLRSSISLFYFRPSHPIMNRVILYSSLCALSYLLVAVPSRVLCQSPKEWRLEGVAAHNYYRQKYYGSPPIELGDDKLCAYSQDWVNKLSKGQVKGHSPGNEYGENIWSGTSKAVPNATTVVGRWYSEIKDYFPEDRVASRIRMTGHYTAVVWAKTKFVCMSYAIGEGDSWSNVVANYFPPGNNRKPERHQQNIMFQKGPDGKFIAEKDGQYPLPSAAERRAKLKELGSSATVEDPQPTQGGGPEEKPKPEGRSLEAQPTKVEEKTPEEKPKPEVKKEKAPEAPPPIVEEKGPEEKPKVEERPQKATEDTPEESKQKTTQKPTVKATTPSTEDSPDDYEKEDGAATDEGELGVAPSNVGLPKDKLPGNSNTKSATDKLKAKDKLPIAGKSGKDEKPAGKIGKKLAEKPSLPDAGGLGLG